MAQVLLDLSEDSLEVHIIYGSLRFECLINNMHCEDCNSNLSTLEPLDKLWEDNLCLATSQHGEKDFICDVLKVRLVCLYFLEQVVMGSKSHCFYVIAEPHIRM